MSATSFFVVSFIVNDADFSRRRDAREAIQ